MSHDAVFLNVGLENTVIPRNLNAEQSVQSIQRPFVDTVFTIVNYVVKNRGQDGFNQ